MTQVYTDSFPGNPTDKGLRKHRKMNSQGQQVPNMLVEKTGEITPERMKRRSQSKNYAQLWMCLVMEGESDAVKNNIAQGHGMLGP